MKSKKTCIGCASCVKLQTVDRQRLLDSYHQPMPHKQHPNLLLKAGVRFYPEFNPGLPLLLKHVASSTNEHTLDLSYSAGAYAQLRQPKEPITIAETSCAHISCATRNIQNIANATLLTLTPWQIQEAQFDQIIAIPPTDKGNARVMAELQGIHKVSRADGVAFVLMHKDQGAKRYEKQLKALFQNVNVIAKQSGWRLTRASGKKKAEMNFHRQKFKVLGLELEAEHGVYAAGKLDPGTAFLLKCLDMSRFSGKTVLDIGCGYGLIALKAAQAGARVTAVDDDILAIQSTLYNSKKYRLDVNSIHSDVNSQLPDNALFDAVITNPPFHVGRHVKLELPHAFLAASSKHLKSGGELFLVANKALNYERLLEGFSRSKTLAVNDRFKVLHAKK